MKVFINIMGIFLAVFGLATTLIIAYDGYPNEHGEEAAIFLIAYMGFSLTLYISIVNSLKKEKIKKVKIVTASSYFEMKIKLNKELENMRKKDILNVQVIDQMSAMIVYTD